MLLWGRNDVILVTMQHENDGQLQRQSNRQKMKVGPTLNHNVKVTSSSNVVLTSKQLSTAAWDKVHTNTISLLSLWLSILQLYPNVYEEQVLLSTYCVKYAYLC